MSKRSRSKSPSSASANRAECKLCAYCGRQFNRHRRFDNHWDSVKYCSRRCRAEAGKRIHNALEEAIVDLLKQRNPGSSICPSEAAKQVSPDNWRSLMEPARCAARRLAHRGRITITQRDKPVDPTSFRGPIRLKRGPDKP